MQTHIRTRRSGRPSADLAIAAAGAAAEPMAPVTNRVAADLLAKRGLEVSYETVQRWVLKFGPVIARRLRRHRPQSSDRWHLDEMVGADRR